MDTPFQLQPPHTSTLSIARHAACLFAACLPFSIGCRPELPRRGGGLASPSGELAGMELEIEPPAPLDATPRVLRLRVTLRGISNDSTDPVVLVRGEVGKAHLRQLAEDDVSKALSERFVPGLAWKDENAAEALRVILAPTVALTEGETYAVASGQLFEAIHFQVADPDPVPVLPRIWPPLDEGGTVRLGIWCGTEALPMIDEPALLAPGGPAGTLKRGAIEGGAGIGCVRFEGASEMDAITPPRVGPPAVTSPESDTVLVRLDPRPFTLDTQDTVYEAARCNTDELVFGPGCAVVADDRLYGRAPEAAQLWAVAGTEIDTVFTTEGADAFLIGGLSPLSTVSLDVAAIDVNGAALRTLFAATTLAPMPHVVLSEVLANPLGPEPAQEWVELVNDGSVEANLGGYVLADIGGATTLPDAVLPPGGYALVVNEAFVEDDELDPPPEPGTLLVRVAKLGLNGLSNSGEPLKLIDTEGQVVSRFPATPKPKAGQSVSRVKPEAPDGISASFAESEPTPGIPNIL